MFNACRLFLSAALFAAALSLFAPGSAPAQSVVALVNGEPITAQDIAARTKLHQQTGKGSPSRKDILDELIDQQLKLQVAKRANAEPDEDDVNRAYVNAGQRSGRSAAEFTAALQQAGIDAVRFKNRMKADLAWQKYLQANSGGAMIIRDADIVAAMTARGQNTQTKALQYTMQQVIFVTRRNASPAERAERVKAAEGLRARVQSCEQAAEFAREYREVVVKPPVRRLSSDLSPNLQKLLQALPDGRMTPPEPTAAGIEVVAICERKEVFADISANKDIRNELLGYRLQSFEKKLLEDIRRRADIRILSNTQ